MKDYGNLLGKKGLKIKNLETGVKKWQSSEIYKEHFLNLKIEKCLNQSKTQFWQPYDQNQNKKINCLKVPRSTLS